MSDGAAIKNTTGIGWTHWPGFVGSTWNPFVGCSRVSPGCGGPDIKHGIPAGGGCYAEVQAWRIVVQSRAQGRSSPYEGTVRIVGGENCSACAGIGGLAGGAWCERCWGFGRVNGTPQWTGEIHDAGRLDLPLRKLKPHAYFVNSMSDLFHERMMPEQVASVFGVMAATPQHRYIVLTKRIERAAGFLDLGRPELSGLMTAAMGRVSLLKPIPFASAFALPWPLPNVLIGPSVEDQQRADERMPHAMALAAAGWRVVVSYEPALSVVDWPPYLYEESVAGGAPDDAPGFRGAAYPPISWLIVGAESGANRRPFDPAWIPAAECAAAGVPLYCKQGSHHKPGQQGNIPADLWAIKQFPEVAL